MLQPESLRMFLLTHFTSALVKHTLLCLVTLQTSQAHTLLYVFTCNNDDNNKRKRGYSKTEGM